MNSARFYILAFAFLGLVFGHPGIARANCANPANVEGAQIYTQWISMGGGGGSSGGLTLISTQTASASASLQWTGLGSTYNTLFLNCSGIIPATANGLFQLQFGEGGTPTWETSGYNWSLLYNHYSNTGSNASSSDSSIALVYPNSNNNAAGQSNQTEIWIHNIGSTSLYKTVEGHTGYWNGSNLYTLDSLEGTYQGDTNAVTALRVMFSSGNITSGTCSLYGMN